MEVVWQIFAYRNDLPARLTSGTAWGAIWAGMFSFIAIWSVFGILGEAIFASSANPNDRSQSAGCQLAWESGR